MFCPQCGSQFNDRYRFCCNCGFDSKNINNYDNQVGICEKFEENLTETAFDGTEEKFKEIYDYFLYNKVDFNKTLSFVKDVRKNFPNINFSDVFDEYQLNILKIMENIDKKDFGTTIISRCQENTDVDDLESIAKLTGEYAIDILYGKVWVLRVFKMNQFISLWSDAVSKKEQFELEYQGIKDDEVRKTQLKREIADLKSQWGEFSFEYCVKTAIEKLDLSHVSVDFNTYSSQCSTYIELVYEKFLDNSIKIHKANYLNNMYPTIEQKEKVRAVIQNKVLYIWKSISSALLLAYNASEQCLRLIKDIETLNRKYDNESLLEKGAVTVGLMLFSGPIGILNAVREVSNYSENSDRIDELKRQLENNFDVVLNEVDKITVEIKRSHEEMKKFIDEYGKVTLYTALKNVVDKLERNSEIMRPEKDYFI